MVRFLHTSDWQLGMTRHFLDEEAQALFTQARFEIIREIGRHAAAVDCEFVVVCGDVFETNQVDRRSVARALEALGTISIPVYLLPGNHDPLDPASVFRSPAFEERRPPHVHVIEDMQPIEVRPGVELVGAPWVSKRPLQDLVAAACAQLEPARDVTRICVGHGAVDRLSPDRENPALIRVEAAEEALRQGRIHYLALGDRHSLTRVGETGRIWYAGTPEPTDYDEEAPGNVLVVEASQTGVTVTPQRTGTWRFLRQAFELNDDTDLDALGSWLEALEDKQRTIVKLGLAGTLTLRQSTRLEGELEDARDLFAAVELWDRVSELVVIPDDTDFSDLELAGFARATVEHLRGLAGSETDEAGVARDALGLLVRLAGRTA